MRRLPKSIIAIVASWGISSVVEGLEYDASPTTAEVNSAIATQLPLKLTHDFEFATKGLIAQLPGGKIINPDGSFAVDATVYDFVEGDAPPEVHPSLWRHAKLTRIHGLFEVTEDIYQFRGYDAAVMTLIRGKTGWIIVDPLFTAASSRAGLELANQHIDTLPVSAVILTHSHQDHFGGINGVLPKSAGGAAHIPIIAPQNFYAETLSEHSLAGPHMGRRAWYQAGASLKDGKTARMSLGLSQVFARGPIEAKAATEELPEGITRKRIDGIEFIFLDASGTEAPSEFVFYLPQHQVLHTAEVVTGTMHNLLTPRGAKVRDALKWSQVIDRMLAEFGDQAEFQIASHHHPFFGNEAVRNKLRNHRNLYRYLHDQTLRLANQGMTMHEIANRIPEPALTNNDFSTRSYYGNFKHNIRAVYQGYFGWWDGVPANLDPLAPTETSNKYVAFMGGEQAALRKAVKSYQQGDYRWAATVFNHLVFANPNYREARSWLAKTYRQLGYQEESGIFRNFYLSAANELISEKPTGRVTVNHGPGLPLTHFGNLMATRFNPQKFDHKPFTVQFNLSDLGQALSFDVSEDVLFPRVGAIGNADYILTITYRQLERWIAGKRPTNSIAPNAESGTALTALYSALDDFDPAFNIAVP